MTQFKGKTVKDILVKHGAKCYDCDTPVSCEDCSEISQTLAEIKELLLIEMADTKIAPNYDKYYIGYNSCVKEMAERMGECLTKR